MDAIGEDGHREPWLEVHLGDSRLCVAVDAQCVSRLIQPLGPPGTTDQNRAPAVATDNQGAGHKVDADDVHLSRHLSSTMCTQVIVGRTGGGPVPYTFSKQRDRLAGDDIADCFGASPAALTVDDHYADPAVRPFDQNADGVVFGEDRLVFQNHDWAPVQEIRYRDIVHVESRKKFIGGRKVYVDANPGRATVTFVLDFSGKPKAAEYVTRFLHEAMMATIDDADEEGGEASTDVATVERALGRIEDGEYGDCLQCGEPILFARLQVQPDANLCLACQSENETG